MAWNCSYNRLALAFLSFFVKHLSISPNVLIKFLLFNFDLTPSLFLRILEQRVDKIVLCIVSQNNHSQFNISSEKNSESKKKKKWKKRQASFFIGPFLDWKYAGSYSLIINQEIKKNLNQWIASNPIIHTHTTHTISHNSSLNRFNWHCWPSNAKGNVTLTRAQAISIRKTI